MQSILIVDDDIKLCTALSNELNESGFNSAFVNSADDLFDYIENFNLPDLILLDLKMPEKDGFYVLNEIRTRELNVKIIVLTAFADVKSTVDSKNLGADDFVSKPYDYNDLLKTIKKVLQKEDED